MGERKPGAIKLRKITIENIKAIDRLELEFPAPRMKRDLDVLVMGSRNGQGKTAVLESCALLFYFLAFWDDAEDLLRDASLPVDLFELFIRHGASNALVEAEFVLNDETMPIGFSLSRSKHAKIEGELSALGRTWRKSFQRNWDAAEGCLQALHGLVPDPLVLGPLIYFHSYRKVQEGSPEFGSIVEGPKPKAWPVIRQSLTLMSSVSVFKLELLRSMMGKANLFEAADVPEHEEALDKLNGLLRRFAGGEVTKLRPASDNTVDFRISTEKGQSFSFDGLSSGQKEIISTLYLIWRHTRDTPGIVLIDEPELHLNHEWHRDFMEQLRELAPQNQYIIATHSEEVFRSVPKECRVLLEPAGDSER